MSADFINGIGARGPQIRESYGAGPRPALGAGEKTGEISGGSQAAPGVAEGFSPTSEAGESSQDRAAGEATASQFSSAWGPASQGAVGGSLKVEGAANTAIPHQVHGVQNGQHVGSGGPDAGFSEATVYKSGPPS